MTLFSPEARRLGVLLTAALWALGGAACTRVEVEETSAGFTRTSTRPCAAAADQGQGQGQGQGQWPNPAAATLTMDTYVVQIMELSNLTTAASDPTACQTCAATGKGCTVLLQNCYCGGPVTASATQLKAMMSGTRLGALDYGDLYCLRVMALSRSSVDGDPPHRCECGPAWTPPALPLADARLCAVSDPYAAGPLDFQLDVQCPSDGQSFASCIGGMM